MRLIPTRSRLAAAQRNFASDAVRTPARGQSLVEFSLILLPLFIILLGIIQFGFVFNAYVTMTNAAREGARVGTIYVYDASRSKAQNDDTRNDAIRTALLASMNLLVKTAPNFATSNGDLVVTYVVPSGVTDSDSRRGQQVTVRATYHQDLIIPLIAQMLPRDTNGRLGLTSEVTMVIN